jgi:hypothetical protein
MTLIMTDSSRREKLYQILNDRQTHNLMHKIVDIIVSYTTQDPKDPYRPYLRIVESRPDSCSVYGHGIHFLNGQPEELMTPWGGWRCFYTDRTEQGLNDFERTEWERELWDLVFPEFVKRFDLKAVDAWRDDGDASPLEYVYYEILKVDGESLEEYFDDWSTGPAEIQHLREYNYADISWKRLENYRNSGR